MADLKTDPSHAFSPGYVQGTYEDSGRVVPGRTHFADEAADGDPGELHEGKATEHSDATQASTDSAEHDAP